MTRDSVETIDDELLDGIVQSAFHTMAELNRLGAEHELSLTQMRVLAILRDRSGVRMAALADHLGLEKSTMTGLVDRAQRRGLLDRAASATDGRAVEVFLTRAGTKLADRLRAEMKDVLAPGSSRLTATEQRRLGALLHRYLGEPA